MLVLAASVGLAGCAALSDILREVQQRPGAEVPSDGPPEAGAGIDAVDFSLLRWRYGGFAGGGSVAVDGAQIGALSVTASGLRYAWRAGGCELLDPENSHENANCIAALFVRDAAGAWHGGKFDWISSDRTSRDFKNIREGYNGWPGAAIEGAQGFAFVIVSKDGARRTNVAFCEGGAK